MISEVEQPKEKRSLSSEPPSLMSLPYEIIENILARISKWSYPNLSLVSKSFLSLLSSPQLYKTRSEIGTTEPCLYFCLESANHSSPQWYTLWMKPDETLTGTGTIHDYSLIPLPSSSPVLRTSTVAVGSEIYVIGGHFNRSSSVRIFDCRSNTWRDGPNMTVARSDPVAVLIDQRIYVLGGREMDESDDWFEVFDIKTQTWRALPSFRAGLELRRYIVWPNRYFPRLGDSQTAVRLINVNPNALEGKLYVAAQINDYTYEPKDDTWKVVSKSSIRRVKVWCVIENVMYACHDVFLRWYDYEDRRWREIQGLEELCYHPTRGFSGAERIVNYGGKLVVMWRPVQSDGKDKIEIWCAQIALEKRSKDEIWGKIEWINSVLTVPKLCDLCYSCVVVSI
ncbi:unnamed protein product [Arabidopsis thaliana]|nr:F-box-like domain superfamily [Arabidopsis thaliana x Arabidopsis arenosa]BAB08887.1 unnamed protein product [Arabidopsis thaliana]CAA0406346.1 unnamed protein product [Arabidopsis thaliana]VYS68733.1 unnamed protein product [Arabidopsis thaliana]